MPACRRRRDESEETKPDTIHKTLYVWRGKRRGVAKRGRGAHGGLALGNGWTGKDWKNWRGLWQYI